MEQLLAHLVGDFIIQTEQMALNKSKSWGWAFFHAATYTLPFLFLTRSIEALAIICITHAIIDRLQLAAKFCKIKGLNGWLGGNQPEMDGKSGYSKELPVWLGFWLTVIIDNTFHLLINYYALTQFA